LQLYILTAQTGFVNQSLSQGDSLLRMAITLLTDFPKQIEMEGKLISSEKYLYEAICNMMSTLIAVPVSKSVALINDPVYFEQCS
jgi:hypothetical protein